MNVFVCIEKYFLSYSLVGILWHHGRRVCGRGGLLVHHVSVGRRHQRGGSQAVHRRPRRGARRGSISLTKQTITASIFFVAVPTNHISCVSFSLSCCTLLWWTAPWWGWRTPWRDTCLWLYVCSGTVRKALKIYVVCWLKDAILPYFFVK